MLESTPSFSMPWQLESEEPIGQSMPMLMLKASARSLARRPSTVMLLGETGSGKEMVARYIHRNSPRAARPMIPVDCSALGESLFESQMFGHVKGAFTGAISDTVGFIRAADTGSLFLDEIGELSLQLQAKLLRVIQEKVVVPVGSAAGRAVDFRLICATNRNLSKMVEEGKFREDLFFRLHVVTVNVPPLRDRRDDIIPLAEHFLARQAKIAEEEPKKLSEHAAESLVRYSWPGNVRELYNAIEHAWALSQTPEILLDDLPKPLRNFAFMGQPIDDLNLASVERRTIVEALKRVRYNRAAACKLLGIEPRRLNRRISMLGITLPNKG